MSGDFPFAPKLFSPLNCIEKPWDLWVSEIGHLSPRPDDDETPFVSPAPVAGASARRSDPQPCKGAGKGITKNRRVGVSQLGFNSMSLHGLFPQMDNLNATVCHMCGMVVKCSAAYRHLLESHSGGEPILPPPPPTVKLKSGPGRSRHKKEPPPPVPIELPVKMETSPIHTATAPISRVMLPQPDLQYLEEPSTSVSGEVQVSMETGELPVVSIQDTEELPLGENLTDDIFAIMNSEGIQSADDITNTADWKNIIKDINISEINFPSTSDSVQTQDMYSAVDTSLTGYALAETDLSNIQFASNSSPMLTSVVDNNILNAQALKPASSTPSTKTSSRKSSKTKFNSREYDPNKHCGVITVENPKPCTRSLTCKAHALSLRRTVEGRVKPFDTLLAEHRASRDAAAAGNSSAAAPANVHAPVQATSTASFNVPPQLVNSNLNLGTYNGMTAEQQVNDIYVSLLNAEHPVLPDTSTITSLLNQPLPTETFLLPDDAETHTNVPMASTAPAGTSVRDERHDSALPVAQSELCWYSSCPRPLAVCTYNTSLAGGAVMLGKKYATVRSNVKSSLTRSSKSMSGVNSFYNQSMLSKTHINNASKTNKPEVRKLIVTCSAKSEGKEVQQTLNDLFGNDVRHTLNGHLGHAERRPRTSHKTSKRSSTSVLDLGFSLDPLLADEKC